MLSLSPDACASAGARPRHGAALGNAPSTLRRMVVPSSSDVEDPVADIKRRGMSLYRPVLRISREVVRKISNKRNGSERVRKKGICVMVDLNHPVHAMEENPYPYAKTFSNSDIS